MDNLPPPPTDPETPVVSNWPSPARVVFLVFFWGSWVAAAVGGWVGRDEQRRQGQAIERMEGELKAIKAKLEQPR